MWVEGLKEGLPLREMHGSPFPGAGDYVGVTLSRELNEPLPSPAPPHAQD